MAHPSEAARSEPRRRTLRQSFSLRTLQYGSHASLFTLIVLGVLLLLYAVAANHNQRFDITRSKRFTLAPQSIKVLQGLKQPIQVLGFFGPEGPERDQFNDLLQQYVQHTPLLSYERIDLDRQLARAQQYQITMYNTVVVAGNNRQEKIFRMEESALTNAIVKVTRQTNKVVYFVTGHGEPALTDSAHTGYSAVKQALEQQNYVVRDLLLARQQQVPDDAAVVVVSGPHQDLLPPELEALTAFINRGGNLFFLLDPDTTPALVAFVRRYGLELQDDVVIETNALGRLVGGDYLMPVVMSYEAHPITKDFGNTMTMFPVVRSVQIAQELPADVQAQTLVLTSPESWAETDLTTLKEGHSTFDPEHDRQGPISIAAVATIDLTKGSETPAPSAPAPSAPAAATLPPDATASAAADPAVAATKARPKARLVVFGDSEFASNNFFSAIGNSNLFLNTVSWLAEEDELIAIRPHQDGNSGPVMLTEAQAPLIFLLPVVLLPLAVFATGAMVFWRRRWQQ